MASGDFLENLPLLFIGIAMVFIIYYIAKHQMGVNSVFKNLGSFGSIQGSDRYYPGLQGIYYGRPFNCYYEDVESKPGQFFLISLYIGRKIEANLVLSLGLKRRNVFKYNLQKEYFSVRNLPPDFADKRIAQLMYLIYNSRNFNYFVKISIETDSVKYYHHLTGMKMDYLQNILSLLILMAERAEKIGSVFRIKGFEQ